MTDQRHHERRLIEIVDAVLDQLRQSGMHPPPHQSLVTPDPQQPWLTVPEINEVSVINADE